MPGNVATFVAAIVVILALGWIIIRLLSSSYVKTTPTAAFVRTGGLRPRGSAGPLVVVNGAAWVFGFLHRIKWVSLETMSLEVHHLDSNALVTNDPQFIDLEARFFIKVADSRDSISIAARTLGGEIVDESSIRRIAEPKINGAVRDVAATLSLKVLMEKRIDFIKQLKERLQADLAENGLVLESVSILTLRPTLQGHFSTDDILGAQVARANSAVIENALTEKNRLEKTGSLERARQDAQAERERMGIEEEIEKERAERAKNIALIQATEETAAKVAQEQKREEAERTRIMVERALQEATIENERQGALLRERLQQSIETERVLREQAVALAEQESEAKVAEATALKFAATTRQIEADQERERILQEAMTVVEKVAAERESEIELINVRLEAQKQLIEKKNEIEIEAMRLKDLAEAQRSIAASEAEVTRTRAQADLDAAKMAALGERERASAQGLAEVQIALERVKVLEKEADAIRNKLVAEADGEKAMSEALASHDAVGQKMELARIDADLHKAIEIARAEALGEAISGMKMNLFGDATMARQLLQLVTTAQSAQHIYDALPSPIRSTVDGFAERLTNKQSGVNGRSDMAEMLDRLVNIVEKHYPDALNENPTLGQLAQTVLDGNAGIADPETRGILRRLAESQSLRELPVQTALALAHEWLK